MIGNPGLSQIKLSMSHKGTKQKKNRYGPKKYGSLDSQIDDILERTSNSPNNFNESDSLSNGTLPNCRRNSCTATGSMLEQDLNASLKERVAVLQEELEISKRETGDYRTQTEYFKSQLEAINGQRQQIDTVSAESKFVTEEAFSILQSENEKLKFALDSAMSQLKNLQQSQNDIESLRSQIETLSSENHKLAGFLDDKDAQLADKQREIEGLNIKLSSSSPSKSNEMDAADLEVDLGSETEFKLTYLSNLIIRYLENPSKRTELLPLLLPLLPLSADQSKRLKQ